MIQASYKLKIIMFIEYSNVQRHSVFCQFGVLEHDICYQIVYLICVTYISFLLDISAHIPLCFTLKRNIPFRQMLH